MDKIEYHHRNLRVFATKLSVKLARTSRTKRIFEMEMKEECSMETQLLRNPSAAQHKAPGRENGPCGLPRVIVRYRVAVPNHPRETAP